MALSLCPQWQHATLGRRTKHRCHRLCRHAKHRRHRTCACSSGRCPVWALWQARACVCAAAPCHGAAAAATGTVADGAIPSCPCTPGGVCTNAAATMTIATMSIAAMTIATMTIAAATVTTITGRVAAAQPSQRAIRPCTPGKAVATAAILATATAIVATATASTATAAVATPKPTRTLVTP